MLKTMLYQPIGNETKMIENDTKWFFVCFYELSRQQVK